MSSFKEFCDGRCSSQVGNFGSFGGSSICSRPSLNFQRDQGLDVPLSFRNIGSFLQPCGTIRGIVHANLNGEIVGKLTGKIENLSRFMGGLGNFGNLGNMGVSLPFTVQIGE